MASISINAPAKKVWNAITEPGLRKKWFFGVDTKTDWKKGSAIVHNGEFDGKPYEDKGVIKAVEPGKRLVHTHWSSMSGRPDRPENYETITYMLKERNGATEVTIAEENVASAEQKKTSDELWKKALTGLKQVTEKEGVREPRYPNESHEYREARDALLKDEQELVDKVKAVAAKRRKLPPGGELKEDYVFQWANDGKVGKRVKFSELFGDKTALILYSFMFGPNWDKPCPSCTSLMDGFDRTWYSVSRDAAFVAIAKAPAEKINAWAEERGWSEMALVSGYESPFQADYRCQEPENDDMQWPVMHVFTKRDGKIFHFWATEVTSNHVDTVWPYWNLFDFTPEGRPDHDTPPQKFRSEFLEKHYLNKG